MKKIVSIVIALAIGVAVLSPTKSASAYPVGGGYGNQCFIPPSIIGAGFRRSPLVHNAIVMPLELLQVMFTKESND